MTATLTRTARADFADGSSRTSVTTEVWPGFTARTLADLRAQRLRANGQAHTRDGDTITITYRGVGVTETITLHHADEPLPPDIA